LALGVTLPLPISQPVGGAILVMLGLAKGVRSAAVLAGVASAALVVASMLLGGEPLGMARVMVATCGPLLLLVWVLSATRSLTLTMQLAVLATLLGLTLFAFLVADSVEFWQPFVNVFLDMWRQNNLQEQVALIEANPQLIARLLTPTVAVGLWMNSSLSILLGLYLYQQLPGNVGRFGRFSELNFGRVMASALALTSVLSYVSGAELLQNIALMLFAVFWLQGMALAHWFRARKNLPMFALIMTYVAHIFLTVLLAVPLAIVGYLDAWFDWRRRLEN